MTDFPPPDANAVKAIARLQQIEKEDGRLRTAAATSSPLLRVALLVVTVVAATVADRALGGTAAVIVLAAFVVLDWRLSHLEQRVNALADLVTRDRQAVD